MTAANKNKFYLFIFICNLFNDVLSSSDCLSLNYKLIIASTKVESVEKAIFAEFKYEFTFYMKGTRKITNAFSSAKIRLHNIQI
jgi:hypothetical protein